MREIPVIPWQPRYTLTPAMARRLMEIEAARAVVEEWAARGTELTEELIQRIHALVEGRTRPSSYRDGQNTIRDSAGGLIYLPPEAKDVPSLMTGLVAWIRQAEKELIPLPLVAGL